MRGIVLISLLMMLIHTTSLAETATTNNLLPNAGTGQTNVQHNNSTVDGINSSSGFTLNGISDFTQYNELESQGTGTVSATGTLLNITAGTHTTTSNSLDGGVTLTSRTEVQNCEWIGSTYQCGNAAAGQDSYSTTVNILDEDENVLATVTQNRNTDAGYYNNTHTYTDTVTHTGEGARKWEWEWTGIDGNNSNTTLPNGPNLLGAELKATLLDIFYSPIPPAIKTEINETFEDIGEEFEEIQKIVEEFLFEEKIEMKEEIKMEEPIMVMMEVKEEEKFEEAPMFEEAVVFEETPKEEENEPMQMVTQLFTEEKEEKENIDNSAEEGIIEVEGKSKEKEKNEKPEEVAEEESNSETTQTANATKENSNKQKKVQSKETRQLKHTDILAKIDEKIKDVGKNLELKNLVTLNQMAKTDIVLELYNIPFYPPKDIYQDQINIADDRVIYAQFNLNQYTQSDPITIKTTKLEEIYNERIQLMNELEMLKNEL